MPRKRNLVRQLISSAFERHGAPFAKRLSAHSSCVNALSWSGDGRWLASAGDDRLILLWDFHPIQDLSDPLAFSGPRGNVLSLAFSTSNSYLFSGGVDEEILQYDVSRMSSSTIGTDSPISARFSQHTGSIRAISPHPRNEHVLLTGSEDGLVIMHDTRVPQHESTPSLSLGAEVTGVQCHPTMEHIFVTSDSTGRCNLRDTRVAFGRRGDYTPEPVLQYVTTISKSGGLRMSNPEVSSVVFDGTGTRLALTMLNFLPTIFGVWDEWPLATCSGAALTNPGAEDASRYSPVVPECSYVNACTIKQGSFGNPGMLCPNAYYGAGSDDFRGYVWDVPDPADLEQRRTELSGAKWVTDAVQGSIGFANSALGRRIVPVELSKPHFLLYGHKSIINTLLFHPLEPYVATSGVERHVLVHSPFHTTASLGSLARTGTTVRRRAGVLQTDSHASSLAVPPEADDDDDDDTTIIAFFDEILRQEASIDIWSSRSWGDAKEEDAPEESLSSQPPSSDVSEASSPE